MGMSEFILVVILYSPPVHGEPKGAGDPEEAKRNFAKVEAAYRRARDIFGGEHVVLAAQFFVEDDFGRDDLETNRGGVSAVLGVPLWGVGGGYGSDWWPELTSDLATRAYADFVREANRYLDALAAASPENAPSKEVFARYLQTLGSIAEVADGLDSYAWEKARALREVVKRLATGEPGGYDELWRAVCKFRNEVYGSYLWRDAPQQPCDQRPATFKDLNNLVREMTTQDGMDRLGVTRRHTVLLGPMAGIPLTQDPREIFLYGAGVEIGFCEFLRLTASGGLVGQYAAADNEDLLATGWFLGLGLSGQFADNLLHLASGARDVLGRLETSAADRAR